MPQRILAYATIFGSASSVAGNSLAQDDYVSVVGVSPLAMVGVFVKMANALLSNVSHWC